MFAGDVVLVIQERKLTWSWNLEKGVESNGLELVDQRPNILGANLLGQ